jgi:hypothetical protein
MKAAVRNSDLSNKAKGRAEGARSPLTPRQRCCTGGQLRDWYGNPNPGCCMWPRPADCRNCPDAERRFTFLEYEWKSKGGAIGIEPQGRDVVVTFMDKAGAERKRELFRLPVRNMGGWNIVVVRKTGEI